MPRRFSPVSIQRPAYAMASTDGQTAEITMYGDIVESTPTDWWGDPVEGSFITLDEFIKDLEQVENCTDITIRMNSYGGDAGVSCTIHNRLRELARNGASLTSSWRTPSRWISPPAQTGVLFLCMDVRCTWLRGCSPLTSFPRSHPRQVLRLRQIQISRK